MDTQGNQVRIELEAHSVSVIRESHLKYISVSGVLAVADHNVALSPMNNGRGTLLTVKAVAF